MLTPILTVKQTAVASHGLPAEVAAPRERVPVATRVSGNQSDAVLKILEMLNRHLPGAELQPKEALVRLLETLSKLLKFPPLPRESLREFGLRIVAYLENLPPPARLALEKQLGQRNLALAIRTLAEVLKPAVSRDAPMRPDGSALNPRGPQLPGDDRSIGASARPSTLQARSQMAALQTLLPAARTSADPASLQAALRTVFSGDEPGVSSPSRLGEVARQKASPDVRRGAAQAEQPAGRVARETIPLLRAAAAFLAANPQALMLIAAIARNALETSGMDAPKPQPPASGEALPDETISSEREADNERPRGDRTLPVTDAAVAVGRKKDDGAVGERLLTDSSTETSLPQADAVVSRSADVSETRADIAESGQPQAAAKVVTEALETLAGLSLAAEDFDQPIDVMLAALGDGSADVPAAEFAVLPDAGDAPTDATGLLEPEVLDLALLQDAPETSAASAARRAAPTAPAAETMPGEAVAVNLPDIAPLREAIAFAMIPYLPAKAQDVRILSDEEPEAADEDDGEDGERDGQPGADERDEEAEKGETPARLSAPELGEDAEGAAYDLYRRMGEIG